MSSTVSFNGGSQPREFSEQWPTLLQIVFNPFTFATQRQALHAPILTF